MVSLPAYTCTAILPCKKSRFSQSFHVRAQSCRDEGRSSSKNNIVDSNLVVLRERIEEVRNKERLERCCLAETGWNYTHNFEPKRDEKLLLHQFIELVTIVGATFGLTVFSCSFCLCIISLFIHLNQ
ncbi:hypothetical protein BUALT_Bualt04G0087200 [Buddleja alternifolia]|uniref:Uncharacterized protein n=1 Tax=Buddleja alternifolia TaxID=168488 RepID=A0AAV6XUU4_9LAMI|nr:hypothetical protein BUALT_Bualt04G0087200 [Buddleja alternifolia]